MFQSPLWAMSCVIEFWSGCRCCLQFLLRTFGNQFDSLLAAAFPLQAPESTPHWIPHISYVCLFVRIEFIYLHLEPCVQGARRLLCWNCCLGVYLSFVKRMEPVWCFFFPHSFGIWFLLISCSTYVPPCWAAFASSRSWYGDRVLVWVPHPGCATFVHQFVQPRYVSTLQDWAVTIEFSQGEVASIFAIQIFKLYLSPLLFWCNLQDLIVVELLSGYGLHFVPCWHINLMLVLAALLLMQGAGEWYYRRVWFWYGLYFIWPILCSFCPEGRCKLTRVFIRIKGPVMLGLLFGLLNSIAVDVNCKLCERGLKNLESLVWVRRFQI